MYEPVDKRLSLGDAVTLCAEWKETLRLQHWKVIVKVVRMSEMADQRCATTRMQIRNRTAVIKLVDPVDWLPSEFPHDMEHDLVHELLHLHLVEAEPEEFPSWMEIAEEQLIEAIADALVGLKRSPHGGQS
jgi:hypothetical protein